MENGLVNLAKKLHGFVFDFSANENERREVEDILLAVLAESKTDFDFEETLRRTIIGYEGDKKEGEPRYIAFRRFMSLHGRPGESLAPWRIRAEHLLEDLPRIYGGKNKNIPSPRPPARKGTALSGHTATKEDNADV